MTDRSGMAATQVPVPFTDDPDWKWTLSARTAPEATARIDDDELPSARTPARPLVISARK
jgi:hypothetical protein